MSALSVKWYGINALEFRHSGGSFMIDPYVSRDREKLHVPEEVDKYLTSKPDFILMTHAHWDHLPDIPRFLRGTDTVLYASKTACFIMRSLGVPEKNLHPLAYGEVLDLPGNVRVTAYESRHMGLDDEAEGYTDLPEPGSFCERTAWRCGETFAFMIDVDGKRILNCGSANLCERTMAGLECDYFFCGISRYKPGFPELITRNLRWRYLIPTHHDEFRLPLDQFCLRDDMQRLNAELPDLVSFEIPVLQWTDLPE